jgi:hypothetical protein
MLGASWFAKSYLFPTPATNWTEFILRGAVGPIPGEFMIVLGAVYYTIMMLIAIGTVGMTKATGEVLPRFGAENGHVTETGKPKGLRAMLAPHQRRKQLLAFIITEKAEAVSSRILTDLKRGVTALEGKGMYTGQGRSVLMCALTVTEVHNLKSAVAKEDPNAFVIVSPAQEVLGRGFNPLAEK